MKPIMHTINRGSSGTGLSYYMKWLGCPKAAALDSENPQQEHTAEYSGAAVGIVGHAFMELHYGKQLGELVAVKFSDAVDETARLEAERCFRGYREKWPDPEHLGKVIGVEVQLGPDPRLTPIIGLEPYTARLDMVTELSGSDVERLKKERLPMGGNLHPGVWIVDHKFYGRRDMTLPDKALNSFQFSAYVLAWNALHPDQPAQGVLQNTIFNNKTPDFWFIVVPAPDEERIRALQSTMRYVVDTMQNRYAQAIPTDGHCFPYGRICPHLVSGKCRRY